MSWRDWVTALGLTIEAVSTVYYLWTIPKGSTRPHPITWAGWTVVGAVGAWASLVAGAGLGFYIAAAFVGVTASVFLASLIPGYGGGRLDKRGPTDLPVLVAGIILLLLRAFNIFPVGLHASLAVAGDFCFTWFTLRKTWRHPETESLLSWLLTTIAAATGVVVLGSFSYAAAIFPIYLVVASGSIAGAILIKRYKTPKRATRQA
jgi:ammonia channel protein AmtB